RSASATCAPCSAPSGTRCSSRPAGSATTRSAPGSRRGPPPAAPAPAPGPRAPRGAPRGGARPPPPKGARPGPDRPPPPPAPAGPGAAVTAAPPPPVSRPAVVSPRGVDELAPGERDEPVERLLAVMGEHGAGGAVLVPIDEHDDYVRDVLREHPWRFAAVAV